jgi:hypothetical protein
LRGRTARRARKTLLESELGAFVTEVFRLLRTEVRIGALIWIRLRNPLSVLHLDIDHFPADPKWQVPLR